MAMIQIDPGQVRDTGAKFTTMQQDVEGLVSRARTEMNNLESQFKGVRAGKIFSEWGNMQSRLTAATNALGDAGQLLNRAAQDFSDVDTR